MRHLSVGPIGRQNSSRYKGYSGSACTVNDCQIIQTALPKIVQLKQVDDRLGQANVLHGLGDLDSHKNPKQAARCFFEAAQLFDMIGMTEQHDAALREADKLYKK